MYHFVRNSSLILSDVCIPAAVGQVYEFYTSLPKPFISIFKDPPLIPSVSIEKQERPSEAETSSMEIEQPK